MSEVAAGVLRHLVQLQRLIKLQNPVTGAMDENWVNYGRKFWAEIVPSSAREFIASGAEQSEVRGRIRMRYRRDIDSTMRIVYRGKAYALLGVMPDAQSMQSHLTMMISEGVIL
jgi:SPP1 family predicted phage head-tail adaptor